MRLRLVLVGAAVGLLALAGFFLAPSPVEIHAAGALPDPANLPALEGQVLLTVGGLDPSRFAGGTVQLDQARLALLGENSIETTSIWTEGRHRYTGVLLADLLRWLDPDGSAVSIQLLALNDYAVDLPVKEVGAEAPLLAYLDDGVPMPVRDKGPVWVIYPYDSSEDYRTDTVFSRSVWQLDRITLLR